MEREKYRLPTPTVGKLRNSWLSSFTLTVKETLRGNFNSAAHARGNVFAGDLWRPSQADLHWLAANAPHNRQYFLSLMF